MSDDESAGANFAAPRDQRKQRRKSAPPPRRQDTRFNPVDVTLDTHMTTNGAQSPRKTLTFDTTLYHYPWQLYRHFWFLLTTLGLPRYISSAGLTRFAVEKYWREVRQFDMSEHGRCYIDLGFAELSLGTANVGLGLVVACSLWVILWSRPQSVLYDQQSTFLKEEARKLQRPSMDIEDGAVEMDQSVSSRGEASKLPNGGEVANGGYGTMPGESTPVSAKLATDPDAEDTPLLNGHASQPSCLPLRMLQSMWNSLCAVFRELFLEGHWFVRVVKVSSVIGAIFTMNAAFLGATKLLLSWGMAPGWGSGTNLLGLWAMASAGVDFYFFTYRRTIAPIKLLLETYKNNQSSHSLSWVAWLAIGLSLLGGFSFALNIFFSTWHGVPHFLNAILGVEVSERNGADNLPMLITSIISAVAGFISSGGGRGIKLYELLCTIFGHESVFHKDTMKETDMPYKKLYGLPETDQQGCWTAWFWMKMAAHMPLSLFDLYFFGVFYNISGWDSFKNMGYHAATASKHLVRFLSGMVPTMIACVVAMHLSFSNLSLYKNTAKARHQQLPDMSAINVCGAASKNDESFSDSFREQHRWFAKHVESGQGEVSSPTRGFGCAQSAIM